MSKAITTPSITRRAALGSLAAVAAIVPASAVAGAVCAIDPIYSLIEAHREVRAAFSDATKEEPERRTPAHDAWERRTSAAGDREIEATEALFAVAPATLQGAVALLRYVSEVEETGHAGELLMHAMCDENAGYAFNALVGSLIVALAPLVRQ